MVSDKRLLNSITKNTLATLGSLLKTHLSMSSSHVVNRNSCVPQCLLVLGTSRSEACASTGLHVCWRSEASSLTLFPRFSWAAETAGGVRACGNRRAVSAKHKNRRQLNPILLQDAALIMHWFYSFMRFSFFVWQPGAGCVGVPPPLPFFHRLTSAFNLAFCSVLQKAGDCEGREVKAAERGVGLPRGVCLGWLLCSSLRCGREKKGEESTTGDRLWLLTYCAASHPALTLDWSPFPAAVAEGQTRKHSYGLQNQS